MPLRFRILAADDRTPPEEPAPSADRLVDVADELQEIRFGRRAGLEVELPFPALSALHARLVRFDGGWMLEDLGSTNGTIIGDRRLVPRGTFTLSPGQSFRLAHIAIVFEGAISANRAYKRAEGTGTIARRLVSDLFARRDAAEAPQVIVVNGPYAGRSMRLERPDRPYTMGRAPTCDLPVDLDEVSREHAGFTRRWEGVFVQDLGSKNGINVAGARITGAHRVRDGDAIDVGPVNLRLDDPEDRYLRAMEAAETPAPPTRPTRVPQPAASGPVPARRRRGAVVAIVTAVLVLLVVVGLVIGLVLGS